MMNWFAVSIVAASFTVFSIICALVAYVAGYIRCSRNIDSEIKKEADRMVDSLLKQEIGKTIAGINDGKTYTWKIEFDNDGESKCNVMRFGVGCRLSSIVNLINRRAIEWGCDITRIEVRREDVQERTGK